MGQRLGFGDEATSVLAEYLSSEPTTAALIALSHRSCSHGAVKTIEADGSRWRFHATSTASDPTSTLVLTPTSGTGRWLREAGALRLVLPFTFATADGTVLYTLPAGVQLLLRQLWWSVGTGFTGGSSSAIGVDSSNAGASTAGNLLGGAGGDIASTLVAGLAGGTLGAKMGGNAAVILNAGDTIKFNRIASAFTAGAGSVNVLAEVLSNLGA